MSQLLVVDVAGDVLVVVDVVGDVLVVVDVVGEVLVVVDVVVDLHLSLRFVAHEKGDRPPSLKGRRPVMSTVEMFLWRNYLIFLSCTAPPSTSLQASLMSSGDGSACLEKQSK